MISYARCSKIPKRKNRPFGSGGGRPRCPPVQAPHGPPTFTHLLDEYR